MEDDELWQLYERARDDLFKLERALHDRGNDNERGEVYRVRLKLGDVGNRLFYARGGKG